MPYNNFKGYNGRRRNGRRSKYTQAEKIAFRFGQEQRVKKSLASASPSRVKTAYQKGYAGSPQSSKEPLF